jgi:uncharacterized protein involved in exopolysaccharide biosynthesis
VADADNPAYVQIQAQLAATLSDLKANDTQVGKLRTQVTQYERNVSLAPTVEKEYRELNRDYDNARLKYQEVRSKQVEARTAQDLETDRKGEKFTPIDPPLPPEQPVSPNRPLVFWLGVFLSAGLAFGLVWMLDRLDTTVRSRDDLLKLLGVAPLALIPHIGTDEEQRTARRQMQIAAGGALASLCVGILLVHLLYQPLDVLWFSLARRLGL